MAYLLVASPAIGQAFEMGTAFTYQGRLKLNGSAVTDTCDFEFSLWDAQADATQIGSTLTFDGGEGNPPPVSVNGGMFTVRLDFEIGAFTGQARWLEMAVCCPSSCTLETLDPRQEMTPAPYSLRASNGVGGPDALNVTTNGRVGIGTDAPGHELDVSGTIRARGTVGPHLVIHDTDGSNTLPGIQFTNSYLLTLSGDDESNETFGFYSVVGHTRANDARLRAFGKATGHWGKYIEITHDGTDGYISTDAGDIVLQPAGNVGIGTTDPTDPAAKLHVAGNTRTDTLEITGGSPLEQALAGWGRNDWGQTDVPTGTFTAVAEGYYHSLAIRSDGTLAGWGWNDAGQSDVPTGMFTAVAAGTGHSLAIRSDGTLAGWGANPNGQTDVPTGTFTAVAGGFQHSLAIRSDGTLAGWGYNYHGQTDVPTGTFTAVAAGAAHSLAIRSEGTLAGWGRNNYGQTDVPRGTFTAVAAGDYHSLAIATDPTPGGFGLILASDSALKPGTNTWTIMSDRRLKKNVHALGGALDLLLQLQGVSFEWIDAASQGGRYGPQIGLIADEVESVFPDWVGRDPSGYKTLTIGGFEALTTEALRQLREEKRGEIESLKAEKDAQIEALRTEKESQIANLEARLTALEMLMKQADAGTEGGVQ
jgi:hypothetical protein